MSRVRWGSRATRRSSVVWCERDVGWRRAPVAVGAPRSPSSLSSASSSSGRAESRPRPVATASGDANQPNSPSPTNGDAETAEQNRRRRRRKASHTEGGGVHDMHGVPVFSGSEMCQRNSAFAGKSAPQTPARASSTSPQRARGRQGRAVPEATDRVASSRCWNVRSQPCNAGFQQHDLRLCDHD